MNSIDKIRRPLLEALTLLKGREEPENLLALACRIALLPGDAIGNADLDDLLEEALPIDPVVVALGELVSKLDAAPQNKGTAWSVGTTPFTTERRTAACLASGLPPKSVDTLARLRPVLHLRRPIVISDKFTRWYARSAPPSATSTGRAIANTYEPGGTGWTPT